MVSGFGGWFSGSIINVPGPNCFVDWEINYPSDEATRKLVVDNKTLSKDYVDPKDVASQSTYYNLTLGENVTISTSPKGNVTLPDALSPKLSIAFTESTIKAGLAYAYRYSYHYIGERAATEDNETMATVTLTPLTHGTHHYQVYIEQDYIIHVWELTNEAQ